MDILRRISAVLGDIIVRPVKNVWQKVFAKPVEPLSEDIKPILDKYQAKLFTLYLESPGSEDGRQSLEESERRERLNLAWAGAISAKSQADLEDHVLDDQQNEEAEDYSSLRTTLIPSWIPEPPSSGGTNTTGACSTGTYSVCVKSVTKPKRKRKPQSGRKPGKNGKRRGRNGR
jgi:hypothetical protein